MKTSVQQDVATELWDKVLWRLDDWWQAGDEVMLVMQTHEEMMSMYQAMRDTSAVMNLLRTLVQNREAWRRWKQGSGVVDSRQWMKAIELLWQWFDD